MKQIISTRQYINGLKFSLLFEIIVVVLLYLIWIIFRIGSVIPFPMDALTLGLGGLLLIISGIIGPGRYSKDYSMIIYTPRSGTSFSDYVPVGAFTVDENIKDANIIINDHNVGKIKFNNFIGRKNVQREKILEHPMNYIWLEKNGIKSNKTYFTLFDFDESMTDEEIEEFSNYEKVEEDVELEPLRDKYMQKKNKRIGSISLGILTAAIITMIIGVLIENYR